MKRSLKHANDDFKRPNPSLPLNLWIDTLCIFKFMKDQEMHLGYFIMYLIIKAHLTFSMCNVSFLQLKYRRDMISWILLMEKITY